MTHASAKDNDEAYYNAIRRRLLELCRDMEIGVTTPEEFSSFLLSSKETKTLFTSLLPLLLDANLFATSPHLGETVSILGDPQLASNVQFTRPTMATASFLNAVQDDFVPSSLLRRMRRNAKYAANAFNWSHVLTSSVLHSCIKQCRAFHQHDEETVASDVTLPPHDVKAFEAWLLALKNNPVGMIEDIARQIDEIAETDFPAFSAFAFDCSNETRSAVEGAFEKLRQRIEQEQLDHTDTTLRAHSFLFLLTQNIVNHKHDFDRLDWNATALAYAILFKQFPAARDQEAWWSSVLTALGSLHAVADIDKSRYILLIPFLSVDHPPFNTLLHLMNLISTSVDSYSLYTVLRLSPAAGNCKLEGKLLYRFIASCLPLPDIFFQQNVNSLAM